VTEKDTLVLVGSLTSPFLSYVYEDANDVDGSISGNGGKPVECPRGTLLFAFLHMKLTRSKEKKS
jgi:hypothetical protein